MTSQPYGEEPEKKSRDQGASNWEAKGQPDHPIDLGDSHVLQQLLCVGDGPHEAYDRHPHEDSDQGGDHDQVPVLIETKPGTQLSEALEVV